MIKQGVKLVNLNKECMEGFCTVFRGYFKMKVEKVANTATVWGGGGAGESPVSMHVLCFWCSVGPSGPTCCCALWAALTWAAWWPLTVASSCGPPTPLASVPSLPPSSTLDDPACPCSIPYTFALCFSPQGVGTWRWVSLRWSPSGVI